MNALARDHAAERIVGVRLEHSDHALGRLLDADAERIGAFLLESLQRLRDIELHLAAEEIVGIEPAENRIAIGDRRLRTAAAKADGAWDRARALRTERDLSRQRIDLDDHAGAGADGVQMQRRHVELEPVHDRLVLDARLAPRDDPHVEGGATHVGTDETVIADELADVGRAEDAADRPRDHRLVQARMIDGGQAAEGEQRLHAILEAVLLGNVLDALELLAAARGRIGFDQHAVEPRLLAHDRAHLVARVDEHLGLRLLRLLAHDLGDAALVRRIHVREQQADADRLDLVLDERLGRRAGLVLVERDHDVAELVDPLGDAMRAPPRHQRIGMMMGDRVEPIGIGIVGPGLQAAAHEDHILDALGRDEPEPAAGAREQRVEHAGAGVEHHIDARKELVEREAPGVGRVLCRGDEALALVMRRGRRLADLEPAVGIDQDRVRHGAAGIDADDDWVAERHGRASSMVCGEFTARPANRPYDNRHGRRQTLSSCSCSKHPGTRRA